MATTNQKETRNLNDELRHLVGGLAVMTGHRCPRPRRR